MISLLRTLMGIVVLQAGPQDLPSGATPLVSAIALYLGLNVISMGIGGPPDNPVLVMTVATLLPLLLIGIVLKLRDRPQRWAQTATALYGTGALITALSLPVILAGGEEPPTPLALVSTALFFWSFAVDAHIWRHALDVSFAAGLAVAAILFTISFITITSLAGPL